VRVGFYATGSATSGYADLVEQAEYADRVGFHSVWLRERHFHRDHGGRNFFSAPMVVASYLAIRTANVRIGLGARILPLDHPLRVAEAAATVDAISGGRLDLGVARIGENDLYQTAFGTDPDLARGRFEESIEVIVRAWRERRIGHSGEHFHIPEVSVEPRPTQRPHPPLYLVAISRATMEFGAARGMPLLLAAAQPTGSVASTVRDYRELLAEAGFDAATVPLPLNRFVYVAETDERAITETRDAVTGFLDRPASVIKDFLRLGGEEPSERELYEEVFIAGSPDTCLARIERLREQVGVGDLLCTFNYFTIDHERCRRSMQLFAEQVLPRLDPVLVSG
jgi:alkanesulfonate monooxygenase SsuD/methylene tetrahydromethanopterin reductase-like flavin-dependent oxidoreductase (luciferase family)